MIFLKNYNENKTDFLISILILFLPVLILTGSLMINIVVVIIDLIFLYKLYLENNFKYLNNKFFYSLVFFWLYLLFNLFFSIDPINSIPRSVGIIRFILFAFALNYFFFQKSNQIKNLILNFWVIIFLFITTDLIYEFIIGKNIFGNVSPMPGRLSGVLKDELKIGHFYLGFILICLTQIYKNLEFYSKKIKSKFSSFKKIFDLFILIFIFTSLIIGERSNFLKIFFITSFFIYFVDTKNFKKKFMLLCSIIFLTVVVIINNPTFKYRFLEMFIIPIFKNPVEMVQNSTYGSHYLTAIKIYEKYKLFGVGLKNYRNEVKNEKYGTLTSTHPHQIHFEILSELGITGYLIFISVFLYLIFQSIKLLIKTKDKLGLCGILFIIVTILPLLPSGSFFTTYGAILFWLNFSLILPKNK